MKRRTVVIIQKIAPAPTVTARRHNPRVPLFLLPLRFESSQILSRLYSFIHFIPPLLKGSVLIIE